MHGPALTVRSIQVRFFLVSVVVESWRERPSQCLLANAVYAPFSKRFRARRKISSLLCTVATCSIKRTITGARGSRQEIANDAYRTGGAFD
jgi:hypothetical protein